MNEDDRAFLGFLLGLGGATLVCGGSLYLLFLANNSSNNTVFESTARPANTARPLPTRTPLRTPSSTTSVIEDCEPIRPREGAWQAYDRLNKRAKINEPRKITHKIPDRTAPDGFRRVTITRQNLPNPTFVGELICFEGMPRNGNIVTHVASKNNFSPRGRQQVRINSRRRT